MSGTARITKRLRNDADDDAPVAGPSKLSQEIVSEEEVENEDEDEDSGSDDDLSLDEGEEEEEDDEEDDEDAEIRRANEDAQTRPKKKRKRALPSSAFGSLLSSLVAAPIPTKPLRPLHPPPSSEALEKKALKLLQANKHERQERGHISDVIAGWTPRPNVPFPQWAALEKEGKLDTVSQTTGGAEKEKELRRLAQKGAVRLFNAIKAAQSTAEKEESGLGVSSTSSRTSAIKNDAARRAIKEAPPAGSVTSNASKATEVSTVAGDQKRSNLLGSRGKQEALANLSKASFLELFKTGSGGGAYAKPKLPA